MNETSETGCYSCGGFFNGKPVGKIYQYLFKSINCLSIIFSRLTKEW